MGKRAYIIGISEETDAGDHAGPDVVPSKGRLVDLSEGESSSLIRVVDVCEVVVEIVESGVSTSGLVEAHCVGVLTKIEGVTCHCRGRSGVYE